MRLPTLKIALWACCVLICAQTTFASGKTALQKHADFFDLDGDGIITCSETAEAMQQLGFGYLKAKGIATAIHAVLGPKTSGFGWNLFSIDIAQIHHGMHDSDTGAYSENGDYVSAKLDKIFDFDADGDGALSEEELQAMYDANYDTWTGYQASKLEFGLLMDIAGEISAEGGEEKLVLTREALEAFYDGSLFYDIAGRVDEE